MSQVSQIQLGEMSVDVVLMDRYMPHWQFHRQVLNRLPVRQETWTY